jgi:23S rRNA pseudouridine2605 synthase
MENRKPAGRAPGKYGKSRERNMDDRKPAGNPVRQYEKLRGKDTGNQKSLEKPGRKSVTTQSKDVRSGKQVIKSDVKRSGPDSKGVRKVITLIRLNRFIANSGVCSRRDADEHIKNGLVTVNGKQVTDLGTKVSYDDDVRFKNKKLSSEKKVYILMNKPKDYVTTVDDPHAEHTVLDLIGDACPERVYPVGRLDKATTGVLLLTNDGDLTGKLTHPKYKRKKIYHVFLDKPVTKNDLFKLAEGVELDGTTIVADAVSYADTEDKSQIGIELHSGQNRVIRRMFETLGYRVKKLDRVYFAGLTKKNLQRGKWRFLSDKEVSMLKRGIF